MIGFQQRLSSYFSPGYVPIHFCSQQIFAGGFILMPCMTFFWSEHPLYFSCLVYDSPKCCFSVSAYFKFFIFAGWNIWSRGNHCLWDRFNSIPKYFLQWYHWSYWGWRSSKCRICISLLPWGSLACPSWLLDSYSDLSVLKGNLIRTLLVSLIFL